MNILYNLMFLRVNINILLILILEGFAINVSDYFLKYSDCLLKFSLYNISIPYSIIDCHLII